MNPSLGQGQRSTVIELRKMSGTSTRQDQKVAAVISEGSIVIELRKRSGAFTRQDQKEWQLQLVKILLYRNMF